MRPYASPVEVPAELIVVAYPDEVVEAHGFGPDDPYIDECVVAIIGPSATLMWRRLARLVIAAGDESVSVDIPDLFACLGLSEHLGKNSAGARTVARIISFGLAYPAGRSGQVLAVRRALVPWGGRQAERLPASARRYHEANARRAWASGQG